jgi:LysR family glycine cleavage system transcriptional activator
MNWLRAFEAAARRESFTAAAHELNRTPAAVSYQVRSLEHQLGFPLFERLGNGLRLTDMGRAYLPPVRKAFEDLSLSTAGLFGPTGSRPITIRTTVSFAILWLAPRLLEFRRLHPSIDIRLCSAVWADALSPDELDLEIRLGDGNWPGYEAERITSESAVPMCSRATYEALGPYESAEELCGKDLIHIIGFENLWMRWFGEMGVAPPAMDHGINVDTALAAIEMVAAGEGHAMLLSSFAQADIVTARLVPLFAPTAVLDQGHYLLIPESSDQTRSEVLLFREWLFDAASREAA